MSRNARGKVENSRSMLCSRIWPMASRISATLDDSRPKACSTSDASLRRRSWRDTSFLDNTRSEIPFISLSSKVSDTRTVRPRFRKWPSPGAAIVPISSPGISPCAAPSTAPSACGRNASIDDIKAASSSRTAAPVSRASVSSDIRSISNNTAVTNSVDGARSPSRAALNTSSAAWLSFNNRGRSRNPQLPFTVCTKRNTLSTRL